MSNLTLYQKNPYRSLHNLDSWVDSFFLPEYRSCCSANYQPVIRTEETDEAYVVKAELPGFGEKDISLQVQNEEIIIESHQEKKDEQHSRYFRRSFTLPANVNAEKISAELRDGILMIQLPKSEEAKPRQITIQRR